MPKKWPRKHQKRSFKNGKVCTSNAKNVLVKLMAYFDKKITSGFTSNAFFDLKFKLPYVRKVDLKILYFQKQQTYKSKCRVRD